LFLKPSGIASIIQELVTTLVNTTIYEHRHIHFMINVHTINAGTCLQTIATKICRIAPGRVSGIRIALGGKSDDYSLM